MHTTISEQISRAAWFLATDEAVFYRQFLKAPFAHATACLAVLRDGQWHTAAEIAREVGLARPTTLQILQALRRTLPGLESSRSAEQGWRWQERETLMSVPCWFRYIAHTLGVLPSSGTLPDRLLVEAVLSTHLHEEYQRLAAQHCPPQSEYEWLSALLGAGEIVELADGERPVRLAVQALSERAQAEAEVKRVDGHAYARVRSALGLAGQLFLVVDALSRPAPDLVLEALYDFLDTDQTLGIVAIP